MKKILLVVLLLFFMLCSKAEDHFNLLTVGFDFPGIEIQSIEIPV